MCGVYVDDLILFLEAEVVEGVLEPESQIISPSDSLNGIRPSISSLTPFLIHTSIKLVSIQPLI